MSRAARAGILRDFAVAAAGGLVATKAMEPVTTTLYERASEADRQREQRVSPGVPYRVAAEKMSGRIGLRLSDQQLDRAGLVLHYGLGVGWGTALRPATRLLPDAGPPGRQGYRLGPVRHRQRGAQPDHRFERPTAGLSAVDHVRGLLGHLAYGLALAAAVEAARIVLWHAPRR